ncbi:MAG: DedA family protein [Acetobacteraceae bacterium]|nr:DedA family protein [Acetobacteraceae bacterium]
MLRSLYDRTLSLAAHPKAPFWLGVISFVESSFFPIPPDALLLPMCLARRDKAFRLALICTITSVAGGILGYAIGYFLFDALARPIFTAYGKPDALATFQHWYDRWGLLLILVKGMTPIPYKIVTIASGAAHFDFVVFLLASIATRGARFYLVAFLVWKFGPPVQQFIERRLTLVTTIAAVSLVGGFLVLRYL